MALSSDREARLENEVNRLLKQQRKVHKDAAALVNKSSGEARLYFFLFVSCSLLVLLWIQNDLYMKMFSSLSIAAGLWILLRKSSQKIRFYSASKKVIRKGLWRQERRERIQGFVALTFLGLGATLGISGRMDEAVQYMMVLLTWAGYGFFLISVWAIDRRPRLFFSEAVVGMGTAFLLLSALGFPGIMFLTQWVFMPDRLVTIAKACSIVFAASLFFTIGIHGFGRSRISPVQMAALKVVEPGRILASFKEIEDRQRGQEEAIRIVRKLEKRGDSHTQVALLEVLARRQGKPLRKVWVPFVALGLFILGALGEAFFQDLLYDPFVKPLVDRLIPVTK